MKKIKIIIFITILFIILYVGFSIWQRSTKKEIITEKRSISTQIGKESMRLEKIHLIEEKHGQKTWELEAHQINYYQDQNLFILKDVKVNFYLRNGKTFTLSGKEGKFFQDTKNMELMGDVILSSNEGYRLKTASVFYDHSKKMVSGKDLVEVEDDKIQMKGEGMIIDMESRIFKLLNRVRTKWRKG